VIVLDLVLIVIVLDLVLIVIVCNMQANIRLQDRPADVSHKLARCGYKKL